MIKIGPYSFTDTDARRTIANLDELWRQLGEGRDGSVLEPLAPALSGDPACLAGELSRAWASLLAAGPALREAGQLPTTVTGRVDQLNTSKGGVPKLPVDQVAVDWTGLVGDRQHTRVHHGRPWQALCLWSSEVIAELRAAGHSVAAGSAGENVTISGLPWADVRAGVRLRLGKVLCEVSAFALPCHKNARWFIDGDAFVMHHERGPVSRVYATVLEPGAIRVGDPAILEP